MRNRATGRPKLPSHEGKYAGRRTECFVVIADGIEPGEDVVGDPQRRVIMIMKV